MISLKSLNALSAAPTDKVAQITEQEVFYELNYEDAYDESPAMPERNEIGIEMLKRLYKLSFAKAVGNSKNTYMDCWANDIQPLLFDNGLTKDEFIQCLSL